MRYNFTATKNRLENGWVVWSLVSDLKGCVSQALNLTDAIDQLERNETEWIKTAELYNIPIPDELL